MAATAGAVGGGLIAEKFDRAEFTHQRSGYRYRIARDGGKYFFEFEKTEGTRKIAGRRQLEYFVGSGAVARSYLLESGGFLYEAPVSFYTESGKWDLPPGYDRYDDPFLTRAIVPGCLECHASRLQHLARTQNAYAAPPFLEGGVACERCHGPGTSHIAKMKSGKPGGDPGIVNPSKLDAERRDSVCAQCHLAGDVRVVRAGRDNRSFVAGGRFPDHVAVFVRAGDAPGMTVTGHVEKLAQSACKRVAGDRLWCGTCHDPHAVPAAGERPAWFRAKCLGCHQVDACRRGDDCVGCHMPRSTVVDAEHVVYTDHSIPRRSGPRGSLQVAGAPLGLFGGGEADPRDLALAYAILAQRDNNAAYRSRAFELLRGIAGKAQKDSEVLLYLAELYKRNSDYPSAIPLYEQAMRIDPAQVTASVSLGAIRMEAGDYAEAIRLWRDALSKNPALVLVRTNLAMALLKTGDRAAAEAVLEKAIEFNPALNAAVQLLEQIRSTPRSR